MLSVGSHALLRLDELPHGLYYEDLGVCPVSPGKNDIHIVLHKFKQSTHPVIFMLSQAGDTIICPVLRMCDYVLHRGSFRGLLFCRSDGSSITRSQFFKFFHRAVVFCNLEPRFYTSHSLRIGCASTLQAQGVPEQTIMNLGRWRSQAFRSYLRTPSLPL